MPTYHPISFLLLEVPLGPLLKGFISPFSVLSLEKKLNPTSSLLKSR